MVNEIVWKEEYNIGVDYVDAAHCKLFGILARILRIVEEPGVVNDQFACVEAIKFLKQYTEQHFAQEEGYMRKIGYSGYENHKALHDNLRDVVLPDMVRKLEKSGYAREEVEEFIAVISGWLAGHILIEDQAITGKRASRWKDSQVDVQEMLAQELARFCKEFVGTTPILVNAKYEGEVLENCFYYEASFRESGLTRSSGDEGADLAKNQQLSRVTVIADYRIVLTMANNILGLIHEKMDKQVLLAYAQIAQSVAKGALRLAEDGRTDLELVGQRTLSGGDLLASFADGLPNYSLLWETELGKMGLCVVKR